MENRTNMEDDRVAILEAQVAQAKLIAEEADKKYEEVHNLFMFLTKPFVLQNNVTNDTWKFRSKLSSTSFV